MVYLHEKPMGGNLVRHWANEIEVDDGSEEYEVATYKIKQVETDIVYSDAVDVAPCQYSYEVTDELIVVEEDAETEED